MKIFAYISDKQPVPDQVIRASELGIKLIWVGNCDPFTVDWAWVMDRWYDHYQDLTVNEEAEYESEDRYQFDGVVVDHPATALNLITETSVGVFDIGNHTVKFFKIFE